MKFSKILKRASQEELKGFAEILEMKHKKQYTPNEIEKKLYHKDSLISAIFISDDERYSKLVYKSAKKLKIENSKNYSIPELEIKISQKVLESVLEQMDSEQKKELEREIKEAAIEHGSKIEKELFNKKGVFKALTTADLSKFGVDMLTNTSLSAITGVVLPVAAFKAVTGALGVALGPAGWVGIGVYSLISLTGPEFKKIIPSIIYVSMLRNKYNLR